MAVMQLLSTLVLRHAVGEGAENAIHFLTDRFVDPGQRLFRALATAHQRTWRAIQLALEPESWKRKLDRRDDQALRKAVADYLQIMPLPPKTTREVYFTQCKLELTQAQRLGLLFLNDRKEASGNVWTTFHKPQTLLDLESSLRAQLEANLKHHHLNNLAWFVRQKPDSTQTIVELAVEYYFRREVETDACLSRGLTLTQLEHLTTLVERGLSQLQESISPTVDSRDPCEETFADEAEPWREPDHSLVMTIPAQTAERVRCERMRNVLRSFASLPDFCLAGNLSQNELKAARSHCQMEEDETILAMVKASRQSHLPTLLLISKTGIHYHNDWSARQPGTYHVEWVELSEKCIRRASWAEITLGEKRYFTRTGSQLSSEQLVQILRAVRSASEASGGFLPSG